MKYLNLVSGTEEDISCDEQNKKAQSIIFVFQTQYMSLRLVYLFPILITRGGW